MLKVRTETGPCTPFSCVPRIAGKVAQGYQKTHGAGAIPEEKAPPCWSLADFGGPYGHANLPCQSSFLSSPLSSSPYLAKTVAFPISRPPSNRWVSNASFSALAAWAVSLASTPLNTIRSAPTFAPSGAPSLSNEMRCSVPATLAVRTARSRSITKRFTTTPSESALKESPPECTIRPPSGSLSTLPPTIGKAKYGRLAVGPSAAPVASTLTPASESAAAVSLSIFSQVFPLSSTGLPLWRSALWAAVGQSANTTSASAAIALVSVTSSAGALVPERPAGEPNSLLVMVLMVMGVPPSSMVGRHDGHACCSYLRVSLGVNLFRPPLGWLLS